MINARLLGLVGNSKRFLFLGRPFQLAVAVISDLRHVCDERAARFRLSF
jgi:hypothetical protein